MKKYILTTFALLLLPTTTNAGYWDFNVNGLAGGYYGISHTKQKNPNPNRVVIRADASLKLDYIHNPNHKTGIHASTTLMYRQHDKNYQDGEYRFYPYFADISEYGEFYIGYTNNAAYTLHKGAKDITFLNIDDSNATYFLNNLNWNNGFKSTLFATPKSTAIMNDGKAPKITYIKPLPEDIKIGLSYTPDNAHRRGMVSRYVDYEGQEDGYTFALQKKWQLENSTLYTSIGHGIFNGTDNETSLGITWKYKNFNIASGYKKAYIDGHKNPISTQRINSHLPAYFDNYRESTAWNISMGYKWDTFETNIAYLNTKAENTRHQDNLVLWSNIYHLDNNIDLFLTGAYLNTHGIENKDDNRGYGAIMGIGYKF